MSTKSEVDLFEDIKEPEKDFWANLLNKETKNHHQDWKEIVT